FNLASDEIAVVSAGKIECASRFLERRIDLVDDAVCGRSRAGILQNRPAHHKVIGAELDRLARRGKPFVLVVRCAGWPNARAHEHDARVFWISLSEKTDGVARSDEPITSGVVDR